MGNESNGMKNSGSSEYLLCPQCSKKIPKFRVFVENSIAKVAIECECNPITTYSGVMIIRTYLTKIDNIDSSMLICPNHNKPQTKFCIKCEKWLCDKCSKKDHCQNKEDKAAKIGEVKCRKHSNPTKEYCPKCKVFLCNECKEDHNKATADEADRHILTDYSQVLRNDWIEGKKQLFSKIDENSQKLRETAKNEFINALEKHIKTSVEGDEKKLIKSLKRKLEEKAELNQDACESIKDFYSRLITLIFSTKEKSPYFAKENLVYNLIVNSCINDEIINRIDEKKNELEKYSGKYDTDLKLLEEQTAKFIDYLSSTFLMITKKNDLFQVAEPIKTSAEITAFCPIDKDFVACAFDSGITVYNLKTNMAKCSFKGHTNDITYLYKLDDKTLISASLDQTIKLWNLDKKTLINSIDTDAVVACIFGSTEPNFLFVYYYFSKFERVDISDTLNPKVVLSKPVKSEENFDTFYQLEDGPVVCATKDNITVFSDKTLEPIDHIGAGFFSCPLSLCQLKNKSIVAGLSNGNIMIFDKKEELKMLMGHKKGVTGLIELHDQNDILLSASLDCSVRFWNIKKNTCQETFNMEENMEIVFFNKFGDGKMGIVSNQYVTVWEGQCYDFS